MTFAHPWVLLFAIAPVLWAALEWRSSARRLALALKAASLLAILVALSGPAVTVFRSRMAVAVLVDSSASVSDADLQRAGRVASDIQSARGRNLVRIFPFARTVETVGTATLRRISGEGGTATDLEGAVRHAIASTPSGMVPRIVLVSDGHENTGTVARAAWQARQLNVPVDTFSLDGRSQPPVHLQTVTLPAFAFTGERFPIDLTLSAPAHMNATLTLSADERPLGSTAVVLEPGDNSVHAHASISAAGAFDLAGGIRAANGETVGELRFDSAITLRRPKALYISQDPGGTEANLISALSAAQFDVIRSATIPHGAFADDQLVILNNQDLDAVPADTKTQLENFVRRGGGLLVIGGEKNVYREGKPAPDDPLDRALPAKVAPPRSPEGTCVVLIIDKSSSMEGRKIELARLAASGVVDNLRAIDRVGVLIFDNSFQWAVPLRPAEDKVLIKQLVAGIAPDGGTQIAPALTEAFKRILPVYAAYKHMVLLTDGISEEGDSLDLAREAESEHVTISTVGLGQDVNRAYLEKVAQLAGGQSYFLSDPAGLEQILLRDVQQHTGSSTVEKTLRVSVSHPAEILQGVGMETAPPLNGYVRFTARPSAETILKVDNDRDPLLVRWQYGLGRAAVFTSDAKSRWAERWIGWKGFDRFWINVVRDLLPHAETGEAKPSFDSAAGELVVEYHLGGDAAPSAPAVFAFGPGGFQQPVSMTRITAGFWRGRVAIGNRTGLFRVRPVAESAAFPEVGFYREEREMHEYGSNPFLLRQVSEYTGGRFNPEPGQVFDPAGRSAAITTQLWPGLLAIAILLNLAELLLRKGRNLIQLLARFR